MNAIFATFTAFGRFFYKSGTRMFISINPMNISTIVPIRAASSILCDFSSVASEILKLASA